MNPDILVKLEPERYPELLEVLKNNLPKSFYVTYVIQNTINWLKIKEKKGLEWYDKACGSIPRSVTILVPISGFQRGTFFIVDELKVSLVVLHYIFSR